MANIIYANEASPSTPVSGSTTTYVDSTSKLFSTKDDTGAVVTMPASLKNQSLASVTGYASDTYVVGSGISLGAFLPRAGMRYHCVFDVTKTAAGVATPILVLRFGTAGTTSDAAICTFTFNAQTAVVDNGVIELFATFRAVGASAAVQGMATLRHNLAVTGLGSVNPAGWQQVLVTSSTFNSAVANSIVGVSVNGGASAAWTTTLVQAETLA